MSDINIGQITEALNDKTDRDMRNVDTVSGADAVIEWQAPTAQNNYTWYRKYKSGWVEQGGYSASTGSWGTTTINLPVAMRDAYYTLTIGADGTSADFTNNATATVRGGSRSSVTARTTTSFQCQSNNIVTWEVKGFAA